ncbi:MAG TPA: hypothetical protein VFT55_01795 [Planctomycetota bacterium]|nr:hypothetical protein [Planctomycetota bacterium]
MTVKSGRRAGNASSARPRIESLSFMFPSMLRRRCGPAVQNLLRDFPAVALLGSRQVGKTTRAKQLVGALGDRAVYLDLELPSDLASSSAPTLGTGLPRAMQDVGAKRGSVVVAEGERFPLSKTVEPIALAEFVDGLAELL